MHKRTRIVLPEHILHPDSCFGETYQSKMRQLSVLSLSACFEARSETFEGKKGEIVSDSNKQRVVAMSTGIYK